MKNRIKIIKNFTEKFFKEHITFRAASEMRHLIRPLNSIGLKHFAYNVYYDDGSHVKLVTQPSFTRYYYEKELFRQSDFAKKRLESGVFLSEWLVSQNVSNISKSFKVSPSFVIAENYENHIEYFHFILPIEKNNQALSLINHKNTLYRFIAYFKEKARGLIEQAQKERFRLPIEYNKNNNEIEIIINKNIKDFICFANVKRFYFKNEFGNLYLTKKEFQIIRLLAHGKTIKEIGKILFVSDSTMETHIVHIKEKLKCQTLFELGLKSEKLGITKLYLET